MMLKQPQRVSVSPLNVLNGSIGLAEDCPPVSSILKKSPATHVSNFAFMSCYLGYLLFVSINFKDFGEDYSADLNPSRNLMHPYLLTIS